MSLTSWPVARIGPSDLWSFFVRTGNIQTCVRRDPLPVARSGPSDIRSFFVRRGNIQTCVSEGTRFGPKTNWVIFAEGGIGLQAGGCRSLLTLANANTSETVTAVEDNEVKRSKGMHASIRNDQHSMVAYTVTYHFVLGELVADISFCSVGQH